MLVLSWSAAGAAFFADRRPLGMPVRGVSAGAVSSTFGAPREGGRRRHRGADIFAARGTPVVAAHSGVVVARATLSLGGRTVATFGRRGVVCYYAHLDRWAPGLAVGDWVREGDVLGTVGNTGNARTTPPHLHFGTYVLWRAGAAVDPVMLLRAD